MSTCKECIFYHEKLNQCRRYPPTPGLTEDDRQYNLYPVVHPDIWCGEFEALPELEMPEGTEEEK